MFSRNPARCLLLSFFSPFPLPTRSLARSLAHIHTLFFNPVRPSSLLRELIQSLIINYTVTAILFFFLFFNFLSFLKKCVSPQSLPLPLPASPPSSRPAATASRAPTRCTRPWPKASRRQASSSTSSGRRAQPSSSTSSCAGAATRSRSRRFSPSPVWTRGPLF